MALHFEEHGFFDLKLYDSGIVFIDATGPFNLEIYKRYHQELEALLASMSKTSWHQISTLRGLTTFSPEVINGLKDHIKWSKCQGNVSQAIVFQEAQGAEITQSQLQKIYQELHLAHGFFDNFEEALAWTKQYEQQFVNNHAC